MRKHLIFLAKNKRLMPPIDIENIIRDLWAEVIYLPLTKLDWMCVKMKGSFDILINSNNPLNRQRFTMAHELKHLLEWETGFWLQWIWRIEKEANDFAWKLLVPGMWLSENRNKSLDELSKLFQVSKEVIQIRLKQI